MTKTKTRIQVSLTEAYSEPINTLVKDGVYGSRQELIRDGLRRLFRHYQIKPWETGKKQ